MQCAMPNFSSDTLLRVVPVAQQVSAGLYLITIYSLELYRDGFLAVTRADFAGMGGRPPIPPCFSARDERGGEHLCLDSGGSGGRGQLPNGVSTGWRMNYVFTPAVDPQATTLTLAIANVPADPRASRGATLPGPWTLTIPLGTA
jgi:hypothetical protein